MLDNSMSLKALQTSNFQFQVDNHANTSLALYLEKSQEKTIDVSKPESYQKKTLRILMSHNRKQMI